MTDSTTEPRKVGLGFGLALFFVPYIAWWFLLRPGYSRAARVGWGVWAALIVLGAIASPKPPPAASGSGQVATSHADAAPVGEAAPTAPAAPKLDPKLTCERVSEVFFGQDVTDLQKEELWKDFDGKLFKWDMVIVDASEGMFGGFQVSAKCRRSRSLTSDMIISYPKEARNLVIQYQAGKVYELTGRLTRYGEILGFYADYAPWPE